MKTNTITLANNNSNYTPAFRTQVVAYPEFQAGYEASQRNANKSDVLANDPISALANKLAKAFRLLFTPEITASAQQIKQGVDIIFDDPQVGKVLNATV